MVKTTIVLPEPLWLAVKHRALDERSDLQRTVIRALEHYLKTPPKKR